MNGWVILFALVLIGLLVALVAFGAMMLSEMKKMTKISTEILYATTGMQSQMQIVEHDIDTFLKPFIHNQNNINNNNNNYNHKPNDNDTNENINPTTNSTSPENNDAPELANLNSNN
jgi:hypothetical protein